MAGGDASQVTRMFERTKRVLRGSSGPLRAALDVYAAGINRRAPRRTGALAASFKVTTNGPASGSVSSSSVAAHTQEFGARIAPTKTALRFTGPPVTFIRRAVFVPAQPYVAPTFTQDTQRAVDAAGRALASEITH